MGNMGILNKLDDLCKLPNTSNINLIENFNKEFAKNQYYIPSKRNHENSFTINHYAGRVTYSSDGFLEKNRDSLPFKIMELLKNSKNKILSEIFTNSTNEAIQDSTKSVSHLMNSHKCAMYAIFDLGVIYVLVLWELLCILCVQIVVENWWLSILSIFKEYQGNLEY